MTWTNIIGLVVFIGVILCLGIVILYLWNRRP